jgi:L-lactate dehydrogenase complex protein LldG
MNDNVGSMIALFDKRLNELRAPGDTEPAVLHAGGPADAARHVANLCRGVPPAEIVVQGHAPPGPPRDFAIGVTPAAALIAATGSVVVELAAPADAWASLLVDRHIIVADRAQLLPDLPAFYQRLHERYAAGERLPVQICITGCSRTADIEKLLVIPAHGPRQVRVVITEVPVEWHDVRRAAAP